MAMSTLQAETATATPTDDAALKDNIARIMGLLPNDPAVAERLSCEDKERAAMVYASDAVRAAIDVLAALDAIDLAGIFERAPDVERHKHEAGFALLRMSRRLLREAVGGASHPGYETFLDMIAVHGLGIYDD